MRLSPRFGAFSRRTPALGTLLAACWFFASPSFACSVCYGNADSANPLVSSARLGVFLLLGVTAAVLSAFVRFFFILRRRALAAEREAIALEWSEFQRSPMP